jgi:hypothetical protein
MDNKVSESAYEIAIGALHGQAKRLFILCVVLIIALIGSNAGWLWYESQFVNEETTVTQEVDNGDGETTVIGIGDNYGESETDSN